MWKELSGVTAKTIVVGRVVTATVTLICVLVVYDGWANLRLRDAVLIVVGPVLAIYVSHIYSATLVQHMKLGRRPTWSEWLATVRFESRFLVLGVPPVAILVILDLAGVSVSDAIRVVIWVEALSLSLWAGLAAHSAGLRGRSLVLAVLAGLVVTGIVIGLQVVLEPGKAVQNGVAAGLGLTGG
jgi:hypothetical protein